MITMSELNPSGKFDNPQIEANLISLLYKLNIIRSKFGKGMLVTSGYRTMKDHLRIYEDIAKRAGKPFDKSKVPMKSKHLVGEAVDIFDPKGELKEWIRNNIPLCESLNLYFEAFAHTPNWVHIQLTPPKSGKRFFIP